MQFYICMTFFRVLSLFFIVVAFGYYAIALYALLLLVVVILGYFKTSKGADFVVRGLRSTVTTGKLKRCIFVEQAVIIMLFQLITVMKQNGSTSCSG